jgi:glycosyltransferase involved in cell wall biosynthesis
MGVNYFGDPHNYPQYRIYPASGGNKADPYGFQRIKSVLALENPEIIFMLNDAWVLTNCLALLKEIYKDKELPKIVTYIPVDAIDHDPVWYKNFDIVTKIVAYTKFGNYVIKKALPDREIETIFHGVDTSIFFKIDDTKENIKKQLYPDKEEFYKDSFIVLNASRNQPRKRLDLTMQGFALFAKDKPANVRLYMHCGVTDSHIHVTKLASRYGIDSRLLLTNYNNGVQTIPDTALNLIYNATDVGINTSIGEGWCLPCMEHAVTGAPQVVPGHSALLELYEDCGVIIPVSATHVIDNIMTTGYVVSPQDVADKLEEIYTDRERRNDLSVKSVNKFNSSTYSWKEIAKIWDKLFKEALV